MSESMVTPDPAPMYRAKLDSPSMTVTPAADGHPGFQRPPVPSFYAAESRPIMHSAPPECSSARPNVQSIRSFGPGTHEMFFAAQQVSHLQDGRSPGALVHLGDRSWQVLERYPLQLADVPGRRPIIARVTFSHPLILSSVYSTMGRRVHAR